MNARLAVLLLLCLLLPLGCAHKAAPAPLGKSADTLDAGGAQEASAAPPSGVTAKTEEICPPAKPAADDPEASQRASGAYYRCLLKTLDATRVRHHPESSRLLASEWASLQANLHRWIWGVCTLRRQLADVDLWRSAAPEAQGAKGLDPQCEESHLSWWSQFVDTLARLDTAGMAAGLAAFEAQAVPGITPVPKHPIMACALERRFIAQQIESLPPGNTLILPPWVELTLPSFFKNPGSIARRQCELMVAGGVTPPENCEARLEAALRGQITPLLQALEETARTAHPPLLDTQLAATATTWESVPPCELLTRPKKLSGPHPQYTLEALQARVHGLMTIKCTITVQGEAKRCEVVKSIPHMEEVVLDALYQSRYTPVTFEGKPVQSEYSFNIKLSLPQSMMPPAPVKPPNTGKRTDPRP